MTVRQIWIPVMLGAALASPSALAWGPTGHRTVAYIAEDYLTPQAKAGIRQIFDREEDLADIATWPDDIRREQPKTAGWHYINIEIGKDPKKQDEMSFCDPADNCVVSQIKDDVTTLESPTASDDQKLTALKFLVHFMGDIHQPLHCADDEDGGGNDKLVRYVKPGGRSTRGTKMKLHAVWDHLIEVKTEEDPRDLATTLESDITNDDITKWESGTPEDWAWESYKIADEKIYPDYNSPASKEAPDGKFLSPAYYPSGKNQVAKMRLIVNERLERAGIRLAWTLNQIFAGDQSTGSIVSASNASRVATP